jgi:hypothetical protein
VTTSTPIALVGVKGVVLLVISLTALLFGLISLPMAVVDYDTLGIEYNKPIGRMFGMV